VTRLHTDIRPRLCHVVGASALACGRCDEAQLLRADGDGRNASPEELDAVFLAVQIAFVSPGHFRRVELTSVNHNCDLQK